MHKKFSKIFTRFDARKTAVADTNLYINNFYNFCNFDNSPKSYMPLNAFNGGKLAGEAPLDSLHIPQNVGNKSCVFFFRKLLSENVTEQNQLVLFDNDYQGYVLNLGTDTTFTAVASLKFADKPTATYYNLNGEDVLLLSSPKDSLTVWRGSGVAETVIDAPNISSMTIHYERLFAVSPNAPRRLFYTSDFDITNWNLSLAGAGFIDFADERGDLKKVVSFGGYLYIFREYGITRLYASGISTGFTVSQIFSTSARIVDSTIAVVDNKIVFATTESFYVFDGASAQKIYENVFPAIEILDGSMATTAKGKYLLVCYSPYAAAALNGGAKVCNTLLVLDMEGGFGLASKFILASVDAVRASGYDNLICLAANAQSGYSLFELGETAADDLISKIKFPLCGFGFSGAKICFNKLTVKALNNIILSLANEKGESDSRTIYGGAPISRKFSFCGKQISLEFTFSGMADKSLLDAVEIDVVGGRND